MQVNRKEQRMEISPMIRVGVLVNIGKLNLIYKIVHRGVE